MIFFKDKKRYVRWSGRIMAMVGKIHGFSGMDPLLMENGCGIQTFSKALISGGWGLGVGMCG